VVVEPHRVEAQLVGASPVDGDGLERRALLRRLDAEVDGAVQRQRAAARTPIDCDSTAPDIDRVARCCMTRRG
jgi:hypothetical protein